MRGKANCASGCASGCAWSKPAQRRSLVGSTYPLLRTTRRLTMRPRTLSPLKWLLPFITPLRQRDLALVLGIAFVITVPAGRTLASSEVPFHAELIQTVTAAPATAPSCQGAPASAVCFTQTGTGTATLLGRMRKDSVTFLTF